MDDDKGNEHQHDDDDAHLEDKIKSAVEEMQIETLAGDLRDAVLTRFRDVNTAWSAMSEDKQRDFCSGIEMATRDLVRQTVRLLSNYEFPRCVVNLGEVKIIGGDKARIESKITAANIEEYRNVLGEHVGEQVMLLCVDSDTFMGEKSPAKVDPDQPDLPIEGEDVEVATIASDMMRKARDVILREKAASTSLIQRRLAIGYNKAAAIIELLEAEGFVSPPDATGKRTITGEDNSGDEAA